MCIFPLSPFSFGIPLEYFPSIYFSPIDAGEVMETDQYAGPCPTPISGQSEALALPRTAPFRPCAPPLLFPQELRRQVAQRRDGAMPPAMMEPPVEVDTVDRLQRRLEAMEGRVCACAVLCCDASTGA